MDTMEENKISKLRMSVDFMKILSSLVKASGCDEVMFFKKNGKSMISSVNSGTTVHVELPESDLTFDDDEIYITNINEFISYIRACGKQDMYEVDIAKETSRSSIETVFFKFTGKGVKYRMPIGSATEFKEAKFRMVPASPEADKTTLVGKFCCDDDTIKAILTDSKLMGGADVCGLRVTGGSVLVYMKGIRNEQSTRTLNQDTTVIYNDFTTDNIDEGVKMYPVSMFSALSCFGCGFTTYIRTVERNGKISMMLKSFGEIELASGGKCDVFIGSFENAGAAFANKFDIV